MTPQEEARQDQIDAAIRDDVQDRDPLRLVITLFEVWADEVTAGRCYENFWAYCCKHECSYLGAYTYRFSNRISKAEMQITALCSIAAKLIEYEEQEWQL